MSRDKQTEIEEMVMVLTESQHAFDRSWKECLHNNAPMPDRENVFYAKYLVEKEGYRKSTDLAEEIFAEIEEFVRQFEVGYFSYMRLTKGIAELKKKYTEATEGEE